MVAAQCLMATADDVLMLLLTLRAIADTDSPSLPMGKPKKHSLDACSLAGRHFFGGNAQSTLEAPRSMFPAECVAQLR
jgi:hypothetical protein